MSKRQSRDERLEALRRFYARLIAPKGEPDGSRVEEAFATVEREHFLGKGPWQVPVESGYISTGTDDPAVLYQDILIALVPEARIHNGEPSLHAKCIHAAAPQAGDTVIHVGTGTGYYTAILAHLVGSTGVVHAFEVDSTLARRATENLSVYDTVTVHTASALSGLLPSADVIYVSAAATRVPEAWVAALKPGGRLLLPLTPTGALGFMLLVTRRHSDAFEARWISQVAAIPCAGGNDPTESQKLTEALQARAPDVIRSLRVRTPPDDTAWYVGDGWWLSTSEP